MGWRAGNILWTCIQEGVNLDFGWDTYCFEISLWFFLSPSWKMKVQHLDEVMIVSF